LYNNFYSEHITPSDNIIILLLVGIVDIVDILNDFLTSYRYDIVENVQITIEDDKFVLIFIKDRIIIIIDNNY
jgi:hypothetical protein